MSLNSVVILNSFCYVQGGASRVAIDEAVGLAKRGIDVAFIGTTGPVSEELVAAGVRVICLEQDDILSGAGDLRVVVQGLWNFVAQREVARCLASLDPRATVVHVHGFTQGLSSSPVRSALRLGFEVVVTLHDYFVACPNGGFFDYAKGAPCYRRAMSLNCITAHCDKRHYAHKLYRVARENVQRTFGKLPGGVRNYIALSERTVDILRPYLPAAARVFKLSNPIEVPYGQACDAQANDGVVAVGRVEPEKGIPLLLESAKRAAIEVVLVGDGSLRQTAEESGVCRVTGWLSREGVIDALRRARCLVFPSLCFETFGLSVSEAAALGVPAIVGDKTAAAERVRDGVTGWHFRTGDAGDLARCLGALKSPNLVSAAGRAAFDSFWRDPPTRQRHAEQLVRIYEEMLSSGAKMQGRH